MSYGKYTGPGGKDIMDINSDPIPEDLNTTKNWDYVPDHNSRSVGNKAISSSNETSTPILNPEIVETNFAMSPENTSESQNPEAIGQKEHAYVVNFADVHAEKDNISPETAKITEDAISQFEHGEISPAELVDIKNEVTEAYLKNSFGRELAA